MINIRTITYNLPRKVNDKTLKTVHNSIEEWNKCKYYIRTTRISTCPTNKFDEKAYDKINLFCDNHHIRWFSIPIKHNNELMINNCYNIIKKYDKAFLNIEGVSNNTMHFEAIDKYISIMKKISHISNDGKDNFRFGLSINIKEDTPFFPFAKSSGKLSFSIGLELTEEINKIVTENSDSNLDDLRKIIIKKIEKQIKEIENYALQIEKNNNILFRGFDFSLAPTLEKNGSIISLIQKLGINDFSGSGIMFATAYLTNILKSFGNRHRHTGFSGVMYSLLEDKELCNINNTHGVHLEDIIKLSTMCGCGIDMVPIYENTDNNIIKSYILDICAISCRLNKPLGVRFLSIPNTTPTTKFTCDSDFITNTKVLNLNLNKIKDKDITNFNFIKLK